MNKLLFAKLTAGTPLMLLAVMLVVVPDPALAQSFSLETVLPESVASRPFLELIVIVLAMMILATVFVVLGFGSAGAIADVFQSLSESRRMGDWGGFMKSLGLVIAVLIAATVIAVLVWTWITTININPTVSIG